MKALTKFFLVCSGVNLDLIRQYPSERTKYVGLGATIFFTGFFAFISASYAIYIVFESTWVAVLFGSCWGLMIFNLDRYIVSTIRKDGTRSREFVQALPRLVLAVLISIVVATPLELKIFEKEIHPELVLMEQEVYLKQEDEVRKRFAFVTDSLRSNINSLISQVSKLTIQRDELRRIAQQEADGTGGSKKKNLGPIYQLKKADADQAEAELRSLRLATQTRVDRLEQQISRNDSAMNSSLSLLPKSRRDGLASRIEALSRVREASFPIRIASIFLMLLIIAVETAPIILKLIVQPGPYDRILKAEEFKAFVSETETIAQHSAKARAHTQDFPPEESRFIHDRLDNALKTIKGWM